MQKFKKFYLLICSMLVLLAGVFFTGCGEPDYKNVTLTATIGEESNATNLKLVKGVDDSAVIEFVINGYTSAMSGELLFKQEGDCFSFVDSPSQNGRTTVIVTPEKVGNGSLTATAKDGGAYCQVNIEVDGYASSVGSKEQKFYVTENSPFTPTVADFDLGDATIQSLKYYFYGVPTTDLTLQDVMSGEDFVNEFVAVRLVKRQGQNCLVFENSEGRYFTLQGNSEDGNRCVFGEVFHSVDATGADEWFFGSVNPREIKVGDKFNFIAYYDALAGSQIYVEREFYVYTDLGINNNSWQFRYFKTNPTDDDKYSDVEVNATKLVLIPNHNSTAEDVSGKDYKSIHLEVTVNTVNDELIKHDIILPKQDGVNLVSATLDKQTNAENGQTVYAIDISNISNSTINDAKFVIHFYYDGFQTYQDGNVSYRLEIPLEIIFEPQTLYLNGMANNLSTTFYNYYSALPQSSVGWKAYMVTHSPIDATFDYHTITFDYTYVMMKYKNKIYDRSSIGQENVSVDGDFMTVTLPELTDNDLVYFRGVGDGRLLTEDQKKDITIRLYYTTISSNYISFNLDYWIEQGATTLTFDEAQPEGEQYESYSYDEDGIYVDLNGTQEELSFRYLYADANFSSVSVTDLTGGSYLSISATPAEHQAADGNKYYVLLRFTPYKVSPSTPLHFSIMLDNGLSKEIKVYVVESLKSVSTSHDGASITESIVSGDGTGEKLYVKGEWNDKDGFVGSRVILNLFANNSRSSSAIIEASAQYTASFFTAIPSRQDGYYILDILPNGSGNGIITYTITGREIKNFIIYDKPLQYSIEFVSYNLVNGITAFKLQDGRGSYEYSDTDTSKNSFAGSVIVYHGASNPAKQTAVFKIMPQNPGYLFYNPQNLDGNLEGGVGNASNYDKEDFNPLSYIYWRVSGKQVYYNSQPVDYMFYDGTRSSNVYSIRQCGTFNTETMTFIADGAFEGDMTLTAFVRQLDMSFAYNIYIRSEQYNDIETISIQDYEQNKQLNFRNQEGRREKTLIVYTTPRDATEPSITPIYTSEYNMFGALGSGDDLATGSRYSGITVTQVQNSSIGGGTFLITLSLDKEFYQSEIATENHDFSATLTIAASSWVVGGRVISSKEAYCATININFGNGTEQAPYALENPQDVVDINDLPSAYYTISSSIDLSNLSAEQKERLPIKEFAGNIKGIGSDAEITGINISNPYNEEGDNNYYYGLFRSISESAVIDGVKFGGQIGVTLTLNSNTDNAFIGIIAGENKGKLINVGVSLQKSSVTLSNNGNVHIGGVVGINKGLILQDYIAYTSTTIEYQNTQYIGDGRLKGQSPNILLYSTDGLTVSGGDNTTNATIFVGAVTGESQKGSENFTYTRSLFDKQHNISIEQNFTFASGSIIKLDADTANTEDNKTLDTHDDLLLYGYSNYMAYLDIVVSGNTGKNYVGMVAGQSDSDIIGYSPLSTNTTFQQNGKLSMTSTPTAYKTSKSSDNDIAFKGGQGIIVGGSIKDESFIGSNTYASDKQFIGGLVGNVGDGLWYYTPSTQSDARLIVGITARVSVLGTFNVGAVAGKTPTYGQDPSALDTFTYSVQAVEAGRPGLQASMVARVWNSAFDRSKFPNEQEWARYLGTTSNSTPVPSGTEYIPHFDSILFGNQNSLQLFGTTHDGSINGKFVVESFVERRLDSSSGIEANNTSTYYGDFVVATGLDNSTCAITTSPFVVPGTSDTQNNASIEFHKSQEGVDLHANTENFVSFEKYTKQGNKLVHSETNEMLYMFYFASNGYVYQDDSGDVSDSQRVLDQNLNKVSPGSTIYPFASFNTSINLTSMSASLLSIDQSGIVQVKGSGMAQISIASILNSQKTANFKLYITDYFNKDGQKSVIYREASNANDAIDNNPEIPILGDATRNIYVVPYSDGQLQNAENSVRIENNMLVGLNNQVGANIKLKQNSSLSAHLTVSRTEEEDKVYEYDSLKNLFGIEQTGEELVIDVLDQTLSFSHNENTLEYTDENNKYMLKIQPSIILAGNDDSYYVADVNKKIENISLVYRQGARSIATTRYFDLPMDTSITANDILRIQSTRTKEEEKDVQIEIERMRNGNVIQSWNDITLSETFSSDDIPFAITRTSLTANPPENKINDISIGISIKFNTDCSLYQNRYNEDIYGDYILRFIAATDPTKTCEIKVTLIRTEVQKVTIDNYKYSDSKTQDLTNSNHIATPGEYGLLTITITPQDADFRYIQIENDTLAYLAGNGVANFSLVRFTSTGFALASVRGTSVQGGVRFSMEEIINAYNTEGTEDIYKFNGTIYIRYSIGSSGIAEKGQARFKVTVANIESGNKTEYIQLDLDVKYKANVGLVGKEKLGDYDPQYYASYEVARGLTYEIDIEDIWGFSRSSVEISIDQGKDFVSYYQQDGRHYISISRDEIPYNAQNRAEATIMSHAVQQDGEIFREVTSYTKLYIYEFLINYNLDLDGNPQIVKEMSGDVINVLIGQTQDLSIDLYSYLEYDDSNNFVVSEITALENQMTNNGTWKILTDIDPNSFDNSQTIGTIVDREHFGKTFDLPALENIEIPYLEASGLSVVTKRIHRRATPYYMFTYSAQLDRTSNGLFKVGKAADTSQKYKSFEVDIYFEVYQSSSEEHPIPVENYEQLINMPSRRGANYILTDDIIIPNDKDIEDDTQGLLTPFSTIEANFNTFDGNSHSIIFNGTYSFGDATVMSLFDSLEDGTYIKNLKVELGGNVTFVSSTVEAFTASLIINENNGAITNCEVNNHISSSVQALPPEYTFSARSNNSGSYSYVVGLVGTNSGSITHCRSSVRIQTMYSASGLVGTNTGTGKIASSYFKDGRIEVTNSASRAAGLALVNQGGDAGQLGGQIITSYVSGSITSANEEYVFGYNNGAQTQDHSNEHIISSNSPEAGFVFSNAGYIADCYTNIKMFESVDVGGSNDMAGFVFDNGGSIVNCFSLSEVRSYQSPASSGFSRNNRVLAIPALGVDEGGTNGTFANCFYLYNDPTESADECYAELGYINYSIYGDVRGQDNKITNTLFEGVTRLNRRGFEYISSQNADNNFMENFGNYAVYDYTSKNVNAIWFYSTGQVSVNYNEALFNHDRLELVSANIIATPRRIQNGVVEDTQTGDVIYNYKTDLTYASAEGSQTNPRLIRTPADMERMLLESTAAGENFDNYRIVDDISYTDYGNSELYNMSFYGKMEGNGMEISGINISSMDKLEKAGLFAQVGRNQTSIGLIMNLTVIPANNVVFNNTDIVGGIAGVLNNGYLFNVHMEKDEDNDENLLISGVNFVGGLVGRAEQNYKIVGCSSSLSIVANFMPDLSNGKSMNSYEKSRTLSTSQFSYAGGLVGYAVSAGYTSIISRSQANDIQSIVGTRAGLVAGGLGRNVDVDKIEVVVDQNLSIKAHEYGGLVVGENWANLSHVIVRPSDGGQTSISPFALIPSIPKAVGGVVGIAYGGNLSQISMTQSLEAKELASASPSGPDVNQNKTSIESIGGIIGECVDDSATNISLNEVVVDAALKGVVNVGGIIGSAAGRVVLTETAVKDKEIALEGYTIVCGVGGLFGSIKQTNNTSINVRDCYVQAPINVKVYTYQTSNTVNVGGFSGIANISAMERCYYSGAINVTVQEMLTSKPIVNEEIQDNYITKIRGTQNITSEKPQEITKEMPPYQVINYSIRDVYYGLQNGQPCVYQRNSEYDQFHCVCYGVSVKDYGDGVGDKEVDNLQLAEDFNYNDLLYGLFDYYYLYKWTDGIGSTTAPESQYLVFVPKVGDNGTFYEVGIGKAVKYSFVSASTTYENTSPRNIYFSKTGTYLTPQTLSTTSDGKTFERNWTAGRTIWNPSDDNFSTLLFELEIESWLK